ncbi:MAG TPA: hypothetical protein VMQ52_03290, partial [Candidatus Saccharimonadales bacterium]|nr:hypothetical protein [Candidatus Saccharimonadales bacterium]
AIAFVSQYLYLISLVIAQAFIFLLLHYYTLLTESAYVDVLLYSGIFETKTYMKRSIILELYLSASD